MLPLKQFSIVLMKRIMTYCDKTEYKAQKKKKKKKKPETETVLKQQLRKEDCEEIKNNMTFNYCRKHETIT